MQFMLAVPLASILFSACSNSSENSDSHSDAPQKMVNNQERVLEPESPYLKYSSLIDFIEETPELDIKSDFPEPFNSFQFDKVVAYDFEGRNERIPSVLDSNGTFVGVITKQEALSSTQVEKFINLVTKTKTYGEVTAACFDPGWAVVFFYEQKVKFVVDICLDCNFLESTQVIPASQHHKEKMQDGSFFIRHGFSKNGRNSIKALAKELDMKYGDEEPSYLFD